MSIKRLTGIKITDVVTVASVDSYVGFLLLLFPSKGTAPFSLGPWRDMFYDSESDPNQYLKSEKLSESLSCGNTSYERTFNAIMAAQYGYFLPEIKFNLKAIIKVAYLGFIYFLAVQNIYIF